MARLQRRYVCQTCGDASLRWEGQCRNCGAWNSLVETPVSIAGGRPRRSAKGEPPVPLADVREPDLSRLPVGIGELDRVLGGGLVPGSLILVGGEPGIGKSTLLLQAASGLAKGLAPGGYVLYASGEESAGQVRLRAERLGLLSGPAGRSVRVLAERDAGRILAAARADVPAALIVDSVQTVSLAELDGPAGSIGQVREVALALLELAKGAGIATILVGHVTKDGTLAGPKTLEHLVDAVVNLSGDRSGQLRLVRATKNRFGSTEEIGVLEMAGAGLVEVPDPSRAFLLEHPAPAPGSVVAATLEGSRPILVEVQALVAPTGYGTPVRRASGLDPNRLALLVAVLARRAGIGLGSHDVYANLAGGIEVDEPALDLPVALALASSVRDRPLAPGVVVVGEVGLLGELRPVAGLDRRLREAARLGFRQAIVPRPSRSADLPTTDGLEIVPVATVRDAVEVALGSSASASVAGAARRC